MSRASSSIDSHNDLTGKVWDPETGGSNDMHFSNDSNRNGRGPTHFIQSLPPRAVSLGSSGKIKQGGGGGRSLTSDGLEHISETREHSGQRKSRGRGRFPVRSPFTRSPSIGSVDQISKEERETSTTSRSMPRSALPLLCRQLPQRFARYSPIACPVHCRERDQQGEGGRRARREISEARSRQNCKRCHHSMMCVLVPVPFRDIVCVWTP